MYINIIGAIYKGEIMRFNTLADFANYFESIEDMRTSVNKAVESYVKTNRDIRAALAKVETGDVKISGMLLRDIESFLEGIDYERRSKD